MQGAGDTNTYRQRVTIPRRGRGKKEHAANQAAEAPFKMNAEGELQLTEELAEASFPNVTVP